MSQRNSGYDRKAGDLYETPEWVTTALLEHMEEITRKYGVEEMLLWTAVDNQQALSFFQNADFHIVGSEDRYYPRGQAALTLAKKLSQ